MMSRSSFLCYAKGLFGLAKSSEKTIECNILSDVSYFICNNMHEQFTIIFPMEKEEAEELSFDDIIIGLSDDFTILYTSRGITLSVGKIRGYTKFELDNKEFQKLLGIFQQKKNFMSLYTLLATDELIRSNTTTTSKTS
jgi:hypothetical protein